MHTREPTPKQIKFFAVGFFLLPGILLALRILFHIRHVMWAEHQIFATVMLWIWICASCPIMAIYCTKRSRVVPLYKLWMRIVSPIGVCITGILMILMFFLVFAPVGILLRMIRKDPLHMKYDKTLNSYWIEKPTKEFNRTDYERQF